jgi:large subunit ribosomal protein L23
MRTVWDIIKSPVITEKALVAKEESQDSGQLLTFRVDRRATKPEIKTAVESIFQVKVDRVRTINFMARPRDVDVSKDASRHGKRLTSRSSMVRSRSITAKQCRELRMPIADFRLDQAVLESAIGN